MGERSAVIYRDEFGLARRDRRLCPCGCENLWDVRRLPCRACEMVKIGAQDRRPAHWQEVESMRKAVEVSA